MKTRISCWLLVTAAVALSLRSVSAQTSLIVSSPSPGTVASRYGLSVVNPLNNSGNVTLMTPSANTAAQQLLPQLQTDPNVQTAEQDSVQMSSEVSPVSQAVVNYNAIFAALSNTTLVSYYGNTVRAAYVQQPVTSTIELARAQRHFPTGGPIVAVIDTGIDPTHPAFANLLVGGYDFTRNQAGVPNETNDLSPALAGALAQSALVAQGFKIVPVQPQQSTVVILDQSTVVILDGLPNMPSDFGHGTMVAGLIHLVAPTALLMPLKAFQSDGTAKLSDIISAIYYAVENGASVITMSFDTTTPSPGLQAAIAYATSNGVLCVAAAGNEGQQLMTYPAGFPQVFGVGSTSAAFTRSTFSNYGQPSVFMAAPGEALITTYPGNNYAAVWGTSFSTALVAGTLAIMDQVQPGLPYANAINPLDSGYQLPASLGLGESNLDVALTLKNLVHWHSGGNGNQGDNGQGQEQ